MVPTQINPRDFPDSPYAAELQQLRHDLRFRPELEAEYSLSHLARMRLRVRVWFTFVLAVRILVEIGQIHFTGPASAASLAQLVLLLPCSAYLMWLSWSGQYERIYLRVAPIVLPLFYALVAVFVVQAIKIGLFTQFGGFTVALVAIHFFAGLKFREALIANVSLLVAFFVSSRVAGLEPTVLFRCMAVLLITSVLVAIVYRDVEKSSRREFLEHALIGHLLTRDSLSGLMNRRAFDEHLRRVWLHALRQRGAFAVCMIDVDHFKRYNDAFGHQAGDEALRRISRLIQDFARRPLDLAARYGGEEFSVILCDISPNYLEDLAEKLRQRIQAERITESSASGTTQSGLTVSIGAAIVSPSIDRTPHGAVQLADEALYEAKRLGRNRVVVKGGDEYRLLNTGKFQVMKLLQV